jgi:hypothetical protein
LRDQGIEIVQANVDDVATLKAAFQGADIIFGNTVYSSNAVAPGMQQASYELEVQQGKNIAYAAATVATLELFIWSSLSAATKWSEGIYSRIYHFDSKAHVVDYIKEQLPSLFQKTSILQMGLFMDNWKGGEAFVPWQKVKGAFHEMRS